MLYILIGPCGVGKSTLGAAAAAAIPGCKFYEMDRLIAMNADMPSSQDVFKVHGPDRYWRICAKVLDAVKKKHANSEDLGVCAIGRCVLESARARTVLTKYPRTILLQAPRERIYRRSGFWPDKPLQQFVTSEYGTYSRAVYEKLAKDGLRFDLTGMDEATAKTEFVKWFEKQARVDGSRADVQP